MHDIRAIRADPAAFEAAMARRGVSMAAGGVVGIDERRRSALTELQELQSRRNTLSRAVGEGRRKGLDTVATEAEVGALRGQTDTVQALATQAEAELEALLASLPNVLDADVPDGADETANVAIAQHGEPSRHNFPQRQHFELGEALGMMDFATAAKMSGARFTILRGALARMERALGQFMLDLHTTEHGYVETAVPLLVNSAAMFGTGQLPKFAEDLFATTDGRWLVPTAEVPLTNTVAGEIIARRDLPIRLTALSDCFRSEAGSAGRDTRGMMRQHQFRKVELVSIVHPDESEAELERMTSCAERVLALLELPHRRMLLCAGDTGFGAAKTYDLEVWLPGQGAWREISSCSNTRAFQARRMNARLREADGKALAYVHTLNGSGVALGRALIAVMENHQQADGSVRVPDALRPYMGDLSVIQTAVRDS